MNKYERSLNLYSIEMIQRNERKYACILYNYNLNIMTYANSEKLAGIGLTLIL